MKTFKKEGTNNEKIFNYINITSKYLFLSKKRNLIQTHTNRRSVEALQYLQIFKTNRKIYLVNALFTDSIFKKLEILQKSKIFEIKSDSINNISQKIILTCFSSGIYYIPPFVFNETKQTDSLILKVETIKITDSNNYASI